MKLNSRFQSNNATRNNSFLFLEAQDEQIPWENSLMPNKMSDDINLLTSILNQVSSDHTNEQNFVAASSNMPSPREHKMFTRPDSNELEFEGVSNQSTSMESYTTETAAELVRRLQLNVMEALSIVETDLLSTKDPQRQMIIQRRLQNMRRENAIIAEMRQLIMDDELLETQYLDSLKQKDTITVQAIQLQDSAADQPLQIPMALEIPKTTPMISKSSVLLLPSLPTTIPSISMPLQSEIIQEQPIKKERFNISKIETKTTESNTDDTKSKYSQQGERWTEEEHQRFLDAVEKLGRKKETEISEYLVTKTVKQVISHSQKFFGKLERAFNTTRLLSEEETQYVIREVLKPVFISHGVIPKTIINEMEREEVYQIASKIYSVLEICNRERVVAEWVYERLDPQSGILNAIVGF